ncbi:MAG: cyclic nucleotide-binding domain-containing protein [Bacteroidetes bacterium]|nr:cyclic nucleotide-binding domain-containing protein [Bacteroidota bacterium]MBS1755690.1 cyclic nucleotide-binding domain-containing protein [Bacteroidota bacterium]
MDELKDKIHPLRKFLSLRLSVDDESWSRLEPQIKQQHFKRNDFLLKQGEVEKKIYFIESGIIRYFIQRGEDKEATFAIIFENQLAGAYDSFLQQLPSEYFVQAIKPTVTWSFPIEVLQRLYMEVPIANTIGRITCEELFLIKAKRELSMYKYLPQERYLNLFSEKPRHIKEIPLKYLASYIGVTPQALSRIRKRIK